MNNIMKLSGPSYIFHKQPKKLIFLLHGYGDNAENFIPLASYLNDSSFKANFFSPNATFSIPEYSSGRQWFNPYPNGIHFNEIGSAEKAIMQKECDNSIKGLNIYINNLCKLYNLTINDCFIVGFSQGAMIAYEFGKYMKSTLAGCVLLSGRILSFNKLENNLFNKTPLMIIHGDNDEVVHPKYYEQACQIAKSSGFLFDHHLIKGEGHTVSLKILQIVQNFIIKYM